MLWNKITKKPPKGNILKNENLFDERAGSFYSSVSEDRKRRDDYNDDDESKEL